MPAINNYRYSFNNRFGLAYVAPLGESDFKIEWSREDDSKLGYKKELPSRVTLSGDAYRNLLKLETSVYRCEFTEIVVERNCGSVWTPWFVGRISLNDGTWDLDRCTVEIKLSDTDPAQCFEDKKSTKINLFDYVSFDLRRTVNLYPTNMTVETVRYFVTGRQTAPCTIGEYWGGPGTPAAGGWIPYYVYWYDIKPHGSPWEHGCVRETKWARYVITIPSGTPPPPGAWVLIESGASNKYAKPVSVYDCVETRESSADIEALKRECKILGESDTISFIDNGLHLRDFLPYLMSNLCPGLTVVSNFFQINPTVATTINYVTGVKSKVDNLVFFQKSDVKRPNVSGNASKLEVTPEDLLNALTTMFNTRWRIEGGQFIIEHISFFTNNTGLNLNAPLYAKFVKGLRRYSYETEKIPAREEFKFMEASPGDFAGVPIVYTGACVARESGKNVTTYSVDNVTTDVELCINNPDSDSQKVSDKGMVIMATYIDGPELKVYTEAPILSAVTTLNNSLSWAVLHRDYYKHYRPLKTGILNSVQTTFLSVKPTKKGATLKIPLCCGDVFNPDDIINTALGAGIVSKAAFSFKDNMLALDLLYEADAGLVQNDPPTAEGKILFLNDNFTARTIDVLENANDPQGFGTIKGVQIVLAPNKGTAIITGDNKIIYTPFTSFVSGMIDNIVYRLIDEWNQPSANALILIGYLQ